MTTSDAACGRPLSNLSDGRVLAEVCAAHATCRPGRYIGDCSGFVPAGIRSASTRSAQESGVPDWIQHAVWWQIYPLGFVGAEPESPGNGRVAHRLGHLQAWLDYAVELGVTGLA